MEKIVQLISVDEVVVNEVVVNDDKKKETSFWNKNDKEDDMKDPTYEKLIDSRYSWFERDPIWFGSDI